MADYNNFFSIPSMILFLLVISRLSGMMATAPFFSTFPAPMQTKIGLVAMIAFIMHPFVFQHSNFMLPKDMYSMSILMFKEIFVGVLIGFCANLIFVGIQTGGQLLSMQMGLTFANTIDPMTRQNVPVVGQFYLYIAGLLFVTLGCDKWLFTSIYDSYKVIPVGLDLSFVPKIVPSVLYYTSQIFVISFGLVMPIFAMLLLVDMALAFMSKLMPQMNIFMVAMPLKIWIGLILMSLFMANTSIYIGNLMQNWLQSLGNIFLR
ncbi:MAG: flagellar biosynthetic protein FliR [bacterium]